MASQNQSSLKEIAKLIRYDILTSTTQAASGHPTSCLSAVELMVALFFNGNLSYSIQNPSQIINDRIIFSKGHAAPLLYSLYHAAGILSHDELLTLRKFDSVLEGHPTPRFKYADVATGSLGQGLSIGVGMALGIKLRIKNQEFTIKREPKIWILMGDSEMAEGQVWEAMQLAAYYKLNNLIGILDVNRLGQRGETMLGWDIETYAKRIESFGWKTIIVEDGNDLKQACNAFDKLRSQALSSKPTMIIAKTIKGKGISFLENKDGWHGKPVPKEKLQEALDELGKVDLNLKGKILSPQYQKLNIKNQNYNSKIKNESEMLHVTSYMLHDKVATREAYGEALVALGKMNPDIVVLDAETSNSTYADKFKKSFPERFYEMFIAEQNMVSVALGFSKLGYVPYVSSFAVFLTRAFDQMRIAQYSKPNLKICGSHAGVSIGQDGPSQMALEDIAMMRGLLESTVLYPSDGISAEKLTALMINNKGINYLRTTREKTPVIYDNREEFVIGGSKLHFVKNNKLQITNNKPASPLLQRGESIINNKESNIKTLIIAAGITLHEALKAQKTLAEEGIEIVVMDCYSVKPIDAATVNQLTGLVRNIIVVEDHYPYGGIGEAVMNALLANFKFQISNFKFAHLCVRKLPRSGKPAQLLRYEEIDAEAIVKKVKEII